MESKLKYTNRADLLIAAGESIKMQEKKLDINPICKCNGNLQTMAASSFDNFGFMRADYEFPLAVVEGKPVFAGDKLYTSTGLEYIAHKSIAFNVSEGAISQLYWNPPKPKTVMVELLREDAEFWNSYNQGDDGYAGCPPRYKDASKSFYAAIRKALDKA